MIIIYKKLIIIIIINIKLDKNIKMSEYVPYVPYWFNDIKQIDEDIEKYIKPLKRNNEQYGWYVYIERKKADFGGVHVSLAESKEEAKEFIITLKNQLAKHLAAGNPLEP